MGKKDSAWYAAKWWKTHACMRVYIGTWREAEEAQRGKALGHLHSESFEAEGCTGYKYPAKPSRFGRPIQAGSKAEESCVAGPLLK